MTTETGPIYGVPLIDTLPLGNTGRQQMPSRHNLEVCKLLGFSAVSRVAEGYEVLLAHYHRVCEERDLLKAEKQHWKTSYEKLAKGVMSAPEEMQKTLCDFANGWHFCPEFDYLFIGPGCPEMESCTCEKGKLK